MNAHNTVSIEGIRTAQEVVYRTLTPTPLMAYPLLSGELGLDLWLKHENHLPTGAFKVRGGLNFMHHFAAARTHSGVITATRGNHGQSVALAARQYGIPATIVVPFGNNPEKNAAMRAYGARLIEYGRDFDEAREEVARLSGAENLRYIHSADEPLLLNGVVAKQWVEPEKFGGEGTGIRLVHQGQGPMRIANLRVTEWDGRLEETVAPLVPNVANDVGRLVNRDSIAGRLVEWKDGKFHFAVGDKAIEVPLDRVAQVDFATDRGQPTPLRAGDVRVFFTGRGSLTFGLEHWTQQGVRANSPNFGSAEFAPAAFSRIVFQPQP